MLARASLRGHRNTVLAGAFLGSAVAIGCGGKVDVTDIGRGDAGRGRDAAISDGSSASTKADDDASGQVRITFNYDPPSFIGVDCSPSAPADPVGLNVNAVFETPAGETPQSVTFPAAHIVLTKGSQSLTWTFAVMTEPLSLSPPPPLTDESLWNGPGSGEGTGAPCDYCGGSAELDLEVSSPGESPYWTAAVSPIACTR